MHRVKFIDAQTIEAAPESLGGWSPVPVDVYVTHGYWPLREVRPDVADGQHLEFDQYEQGNKEVVAYYKVVDDPPVVHTYRKSYLAQWLYAHAKWETFNTVLETVPDVAFLWSVCTEFDSDYAQWPQFLSFVVSALGLTDAERDAMLAFGEAGHA